MEVRLRYIGSRLEPDCRLSLSTSIVHNISGEWTRQRGRILRMQHSQRVPSIICLCETHFI